MKTTIRKMGNSQGVILPKPLLAQVGLKDEAELVVEDHAIVIRRPREAIREGWAEASQAIAAAGHDALVWPEFGNEDDTHLQW
jgi:antitoxin MazE